jgi:galactokinase
MDVSLEFISAAFGERYGEDPQWITSAPGRINLIGEHTDYNDGYVFPAAIDQGLYVAARRSAGPTRLHSIQMGDGEAFDAAHPGRVAGWAAYAAGMAWVFEREGLGTPPNVEAVVHSEIPIGSGVSSSAALEMAFGVLYRGLLGLDLPMDRIARLGQRCENEFVGVACGIMDQMASALGRAGHAMFLDTRSLELRYVPVPAGLAVAVCDTRTPRALTKSAYNERRSQCEEATRILGVRALRDVDLETLRNRSSELDPVVYRRAHHVVTENDRCLKSVLALESGNLQQIGKLMRESHESLRDDYEVSSTELDRMAEAAWGAPGCVGARMTGAGFGGACVALVERERWTEFESFVVEEYRRKTGIESLLMPCAIADGARVVREPVEER